jgi:hypothetical protein
MFCCGSCLLCETIVGYFLLLKAISPSINIDYFRLYYHKLFVATLMVVISLVVINGYWWLFYYKLLLNTLK